jgi:hypothetical protein
MIVYQVNCKVDLAFADRWEEYFKDVHLDDILDTGCFTNYSFRKALVNKKTALFVAEYYCSTEADLVRYNAEFAEALKGDIIVHFEGKFKVTRNVFREVTKK